MVEERIDGRMFINYKGRLLRYKEINQRPKALEKPRVFTPRKVYIPPLDHPWKRFKIKPSLPVNGYKKEIVDAPVLINV